MNIGDPIEFTIAAPPRFSDVDAMERVGQKFVGEIIDINEQHMMVKTLVRDGLPLSPDEQQIFTLQYVRSFENKDN